MPKWQQVTNQSVHSSMASANAAADRGIVGQMGEEEEMDVENKVYRPLLFHSSGYMSSELFRDTYEMRTRISATSRNNRTPLFHGELESKRSSEAGGGLGVQKHDIYQPRIRLETLSSRAATMVLVITYLSFVFAFALPYLQSQGYWSTVITLPGGLCEGRISPIDPCLYVDKKKGVATWSAFVHNVSWYAGSIDVRLEISELINSASSISNNDKQTAALEQRQERVAWPQLKLRTTNHQYELYNISKKNSMDVITDASFALQYDAYLYGTDNNMVPRDLIVKEVNQSVWVDCPTQTCDTVKLLEISQDLEGLNGNGYGSYMVIIIFKQKYPNVFGKNVVYEFAYTKLVVHVSDVVIRCVFLLASIFALPCWLISVLNFHGSWRDTLTVQKWVFALGVVLMLWQNPIYVATELYKNVSLRTRFVSITLESFAEAFFYVFWLKLLDQHGSTTGTRLLSKLFFGMVLFAVDTLMTVLRMPSLFFNMTGDQSLHIQQNEMYVLLGFFRIIMLLGWVVWIIRISWRTGNHLRLLPYMSTRFQQLSYRFLFLETLMILIYVLILNGLQVFYLVQTWYLLGYGAFIQDAVHSFYKIEAYAPSLGRFIFLSVYAYLVMFVHLPPASGESIGLLASTAYHVDEAPRIDKYGFLTPDSHLFCVETAMWLLEIAWQAYFDPPGRPSPSGYGVLDLERYGFELMTHLRDSATDTHVVVALHQDQKRLVVAFRGTTSKQNWRSNLRFQQKVLWIKSRGLRRRKTCLESVKDIAAKVPVVNMALPRVHKGFWMAYASIRSELKEVVRLILDENPGMSVYVTGHSMGGALAVLGAYDLAVNFNMKVNMYSFGGPRVGNPSFSRHYDKCVPASYRVVMDGDIVPGVPRFWGLYEHVGTEVSIDLEGNLIVDPSFVERHLHVSSKRKVATHASNVYRASIAKCFENLTTT